jgi:hypothetical protein
VVPGVDGLADHRAVLDRRDVDAVIVATPDHWHTDITIDAMKAGKDVFVEKPMTFRREEGPRIVKAVEETGRICQVGTQQRSGEYWMNARDEWVRPGKLGDIHMIRTCWHSTWWTGKGMDPPHKEKPENLDWKRWLGQVSWRDWTASAPASSPTAPPPWATARPRPPSSPPGPTPPAAPFASTRSRSRSWKPSLPCHPEERRRLSVRRGV